MCELGRDLAARADIHSRPCWDNHGLTGTCQRVLQRLHMAIANAMPSSAVLTINASDRALRVLSSARLHASRNGALVGTTGRPGW